LFIPPESWPERAQFLGRGGHALGMFCAQFTPLNLSTSVLLGAGVTRSSVGVVCAELAEDSRRRTLARRSPPLLLCPRCRLSMLPAPSPTTTQFADTPSQNGSVVELESGFPEHRTWRGRWAGARGRCEALLGHSQFYNRALAFSIPSQWDNGVPLSRRRGGETPTGIHSKVPFRCHPAARVFRRNRGTTRTPLPYEEKDPDRFKICGPMRTRKLMRGVFIKLLVFYPHDSPGCGRAMLAGRWRGDRIDGGRLQKFPASQAQRTMSEGLNNLDYEQDNPGYFRTCCSRSSSREGIDHEHEYGHFTKDREADEQAPRHQRHFDLVVFIERS